MFCFYVKSVIILIFYLFTFGGLDLGPEFLRQKKKKKKKKSNIEPQAVNNTTNQIKSKTKNIEEQKWKKTK